MCVQVQGGSGSAAGRSSDASSSEDDLPAILQTGSRYPQPSRQQSIHKKVPAAATQTLLLGSPNSSCLHASGLV